MTDAPWTSGPWEIRTNAPARPSQQFIAGANETWVANVAGSNGEVEHRANARLIAAAPDLAGLVEDLAHEVCGRMKDRPDAPTCRSPIPAEAIPKDRWCQSCRARELIATLLKEDA